MAKDKGCMTFKGKPLKMRRFGFMVWWLRQAFTTAPQNPPGGKGTLIPTRCQGARRCFALQLVHQLVDLGFEGGAKSLGGEAFFENQGARPLVRSKLEIAR